MCRWPYLSSRSDNRRIWLRTRCHLSTVIHWSGSKDHLKCRVRWCVNYGGVKHCRQSVRAEWDDFLIEEKYTMQLVDVWFTEDFVGTHMCGFWNGLNKRNKLNDMNIQCSTINIKTLNSTLYKYNNPKPCYITLFNMGVYALNVHKRALFAHECSKGQGNMPGHVLSRWSLRANNNRHITRTHNVNKDNIH